jgi:long-subunit fatty acid transport protein
MRCASVFQLPALLNGGTLRLNGDTMKSQTILRFGIALSLLVTSTSAFSAGLEKTVMWSGKWAPLGGAAASGVTGAESLYFNPAGLAAGKGIELSGNFSPILSKFSAPIAGATYDSTTGFSPSYGAFASFAPMEKWGFGIGTYASGGTTTTYKDVKLGPNTTEDVVAKLQVIEVAVGGAYEIIDGLRLGLAYRLAFANAELSAPTPGAGGAYLFTHFDKQTDTAWNGFKLGLQYAPRESRWGAGATWRTKVAFATHGDLNGSFTAPANPLLGPLASVRYPLTSTGGGIDTSFPQQFQLAGHWEFLDRQRAFLQYDFTQYHDDEALRLQGVVANPNIAPTPTLPTSFTVADLPLYFKNTHAARVGYQCNSIENWAFRAGYVLTTAASPRGSALAALPPPGTFHTIGLGAGTSVMNGALELNGGLEYEWAKATVEAADAPALRTYTGDYSVKAYTAHLGVGFHI